MITADVSLSLAEVVSVSPLSLRLADGGGLTPSGASVCLPRHLTDYPVTAEREGRLYELTVRNALKPGERVFVLTLNRGRLYFILDRSG